MKKLFKLCCFIGFASCTASQRIESSETSNNKNNIFANTRKAEYRMDFEKSIGRPITIK